ncbi:zinc-ribbon domain-containing protein [Rhodopirellula halodulae]|uniref:zinc-ribbon domain-containing protein n=1 Tax=Rhodopirellula halodulae TaxID=2894198 RepID=UPI001E302624|nr:zinc-ribbon domain-containing protein [Rhodopirellula sp. JC737]MCC9655157.1 zinc-ribbon domain-containing protein [Rhodopirellula sp. JC737]
MSHRSVRCPQCRTQANIPAAVVTARCPSCDHVFGVEAALVAETPMTASKTRAKATTGSAGAGLNIPVIAGILAGLLILGTVAAGMVLLSSGSAETDAVATNSGSTADVSSNADTPSDDQPVLVEPTEAQLAALQIARVPEDKRRRIYDQIRDSARTTIEAPLLVPDGNPVRATLEKNQQAIHDRSLMQLSALHDVSMEDLERITIEGDTKNWDPSPRSHARRNGERLYPEERSRGWKGKGN